MASPAWKSYEEVAPYLIDQFQQHFGLETVEGKQEIAGKRSTTDWELDAKGVKTGGGGESRVHMARLLAAQSAEGWAISTDRK
jgi:hypothetical protein